MATYNIQIEDSAGNKYHPKPDLLTTKEQLSANTAAGKSADALVVKEIYNNLGGLSFGLTSDGEYGYRKPGADTVYPFKKIEPMTISGTLYGNSSYNQYVKINLLNTWKTLAIKLKESNAVIVSAKKAIRFKLEGMPEVIMSDTNEHTYTYNRKEVGDSCSYIEINSGLGGHGTFSVTMTS